MFAADAADAQVACVVVEVVLVSALFVVLRAGRDCPVRVYGPAAGSGPVPALSLGSGSDRVVLELPADAAGREVFLSRLVDAASSLMAAGTCAGEVRTVA